MEEKGLIMSGEFGSLCVREKSSERFELGELLIAESDDEKILLHVFDLFYGSQLNQQSLELISGLQLEENINTSLIDEHLRNYTLAKLKAVLSIKKGTPSSPKTLPPFFSAVRTVTSQDVSFLSQKTSNSLNLGTLRSGSTTLPVPVMINGRLSLTHHILIVGTTGRGKSILMSNLLWHLTPTTYAGVLVLDPHDEYYGRSTFGLKDHNRRENVIYYTPKNPPMGSRTLKLPVSELRPSHLLALFDWSDAQRDALQAYHGSFKKEWVQEIIKETPLEHSRFMEGTRAVIKRRLLSLLSLHFDGATITSKGVFDTVLGQTTLKDIMNDLEKAKTVIIDTSLFSGRVELLIGSMIATTALNTYKKYSTLILREKPVISIVLEEAPRVLGKDVLERGSNIFSTIAREGRKFNIGLIAITQLPSLIPRSILANMNTKIILGIELKPERRAIIESASQDLSDDERTIASLDRGEAIISSNFLHFAVPVSIPLFSKNVFIKERPLTRSSEGFQ